MNTFIIAEAGVNHNGDIDTAIKLVDCAVSAGADAVKFQTFKADLLATPYAEKANYQKQAAQVDIPESQFDMLKKLELTHLMHTTLFDYCSSCNIEFMSTAFDISSLEYLCSLGIARIKIPSGEITNLPLLESISQKILQEEVIEGEDLKTLLAESKMPA